MGGLFQINPVTKTGQRLYMVRSLAKVFTVHYSASAAGAKGASGDSGDRGSEGELSSSVTSSSSVSLLSFFKKLYLSW